MDLQQKKDRIFNIIRIIWIFLLIFTCVWAMRLSPVWTGQIRQHRNQYEVLTESFLKGHLYMDIEPDSRLLEMENPYDPDLRKMLNVDFKFDHAFFNGHYYMYYGVVPVIILFLPFRLITGRALSAYHATQIFTALIIIGLFFLTEFLRKRFFPKMKRPVSTVLTTAIAIASVWYFTDAPALYCTAISSAVCMMIWSLLFYFRAVFDDLSFNKRIAWAVLGALCGALAFGCRPPVALANIIVLPLFLVFLKTNKIGRSGILKIALAILPYIVIGILLMAYNRARFGNPFEFGQRYQLSNWDQQNFGKLSDLGPVKLINGFIEMFFRTADLSGLFPYVQFAGILFEFPVFLLGISGTLFSKRIKTRLKETDLLPAAYSFLVSILLITVIIIAWSPLIDERYHSDLNFLLGILTFLVIGSAYSLKADADTQKFDAVIYIIAIITCITGVLLFFVPYDFNFTGYFPEILEKIRETTWTLK